MSLQIKKSHTFVVGQLARTVKESELDENSWKFVQPWNDSDITKSAYQTSLVDVMSGSSADSLQNVHWREMVSPSGAKGANDFVFGNPEYKFTIHHVLLCFFPFGITFYVIEIGEDTIDADQLTKTHQYWVNWSSGYQTFKTKELDTFLQPLANAAGVKSPADITLSDTTPHLYQIISTEDTEIHDDHLLELGVFAPIGSTLSASPSNLKKGSNVHSKEYFETLMKKNSVSVFAQWKALALNNTYTVLGNTGFNPFIHKKEFFFLLYMRCLFELAFFSSRNNEFHTGTIDKERLLQEIEQMEQFTFNNTMSDKFLPPVIYDAMVTGTRLKEKKEELMGRVNKILQKQKEEEESRLQKRKELVLGIISVFAIFSVMWTICQFVEKIFFVDSCCLYSAFGISSLVLTIGAIILWVCGRRKKRIDK